MRKIRNAAFGGVAALCVAGVAVAANYHSRVMNVALPDGSVARIEYQGDVAPNVKIEAPVRFVPVGVANVFEASPFDAFDRIAADLNRQTEAMIEQANILQREAFAPDGKLNLTAFGNLPAGTIDYSSIMTSDGKSTCTRNWQVTSQGANAQPKVVSTSSGDCAALSKAVPATATERSSATSATLPSRTV